MERLPADLSVKILQLMDHRNLAAAQRVCRKWKMLASDDMLWSKLFRERWGEDHAAFYEPTSSSKSWKDVYQTRDRCDRIGFGLKIIREGRHYYLVHRGEIQQHLGSKRKRREDSGGELGYKPVAEESRNSILDKIIFFVGDLEVASADAKRNQVLQID